MLCISDTAILRIVAAPELADVGRAAGGDLAGVRHASPPLGEVGERVGRTPAVRPRASQPRRPARCR